MSDECGVMNAEVGSRNEEVGSETSNSETIELASEPQEPEALAPGGNRKPRNMRISRNDGFVHGKHGISRNRPEAARIALLTPDS
jgi:hypothetical protein